MVNSTLLVAVVEFIEKHSSSELVKLLKVDAAAKEMVAEKGINSKVIVTIVSSVFKIKPVLIFEGGNNQAIYRNACYYFHEKYDSSYSIKGMVDIYGKLPNSVRNGLKNINNILEEPRVNKEYHKALIKIDSKLSEIDSWQKQTELEQTQIEIKVSELRKTQG